MSDTYELCCHIIASCHKMSRFHISFPIYGLVCYESSLKKNVYVVFFSSLSFFVCVFSLLDFFNLFVLTKFVFLFGLKYLVQILEICKYLYCLAWNTRATHVYGN